MMDNNVPSLRFKEFSGAWEKKEFGTIVSNKSIKYNPASSTKSMRCIELEHIEPNTGKILGYIDSLITNSIKNVFEKGDVLYGKLRPYLNKYYFAQFDGVCSSEIWVLKGIDLNNKFLSQLIQCSYFKNSVIKTTGSKMPRADWNILNETEFRIPNTVAEQEKIANYLSALDEKINLLSEKEKNLAQYKKAMMQKLFAQEIRFKDDEGKAFEDWKEKKLGEVAKITTGKLDANAMSSDGQYRFYTCAKEYYLIDKYAFDLEALLISGNGANVGYIHYYKGKFNAYQRTYVLYDLIHNYQFIRYQLEQFLYRRIAKEKNEGNTPYIVLSTLSQMNLFIPCLAEQEKIGNFLSAIDEKINAVQKQKEAMQAFKKAMLQQMFV